MKRIGRAAGILLGAFILIAAGIVIYYTAAEYRPADIEAVFVSGEGESILDGKDSFSIMTFNIGYGCNSAENDFFMDGGNMTRPESPDIVNRNIDGIIETVKRAGADVVFLQEVDAGSKRSYQINQVDKISSSVDMNSAYSRNFWCKYVPYPLPHTIGAVDSGVVTLNRFLPDKADRYNLPTPFSWPVRTCQLKRCLLVERVPVKGTDKEVVFVNLHLDAYDDGEGRKAQTRVLADFLIEEYKKGNYCIAGGDFNQYFPMADNSKYPIINEDFYVPAMLEEGILPDSWTWAVDDAVPTARLLNEPYEKNNPNTQFYVIDGFILSPNVELLEAATLDEQFKWSDHNPVFIRVSLK